MTRWRAAGLHLLLSALVLTLTAITMMVLWYPPSLFHVSGVDRLLVVLTCIDVTVGPLLTLLIYRHGKPGLRFDLVVVAVLQASFFLYGIGIFAKGRPVILAANVDRFELVFANEITPADWRLGRPPYDHAGYGRPRLVGVVMPSDPQAHNALLFQELQGKLAAHQPRLYGPYVAVSAGLLRHARDVSLLRSSPDAQAQLDDALRSLKRPPQDVRWLPLDSSRGSAIQLVDARDATPLAILRADPWDLQCAPGCRDAAPSAHASSQERTSANSTVVGVAGP